MKVTKKALDEFIQVLNSEDPPFAGIRIFTQQGCCGLSLQMNAVKNASEEDKKVSFDSVIFFIESQAEELLAGVTIEYGTNGFWLDGIKRVGCC